MSHDPAASILADAVDDRAVRAALAARSVQELFGQRALGIPGTWLAAITFPGPSRTNLTWHYWWQAHLLDALVDAALREASSGGDPEPLRKRAHQLLRGIAVRSGGSVVINSFFDDMSWLMLALGRLRQLDQVCGASSGDVLRAGSLLLSQIRSAHTDDLGGGMFWSRERTYKNAATTGPAALIAARTASDDSAERLLSWLRENLWDAQRGVFWDGIKLLAAGSGKETTQRDDAVYSYNSGPVLAACLEHAAVVPRDRARSWLEWAGQIIAGAESHFGRDSTSAAGRRRRSLSTHGTGDGGLFTGILVRNLAEAAEDPQLPEASRLTARRLVLDTADALWDGRREFDPGMDPHDPNARPEPRRVRAIFSSDPLQDADRTQRVGSPVQLSTQIQSWMILEAAARLERSLR